MTLVERISASLFCPTPPTAHVALALASIVLALSPDEWTNLAAELRTLHTGNPTTKEQLAILRLRAPGDLKALSAFVSVLRALPPPLQRMMLTGAHGRIWPFFDKIERTLTTSRSGKLS